MENDKHQSTLRNLSALVDFGNLINSSLEIEFILNNLLLTSFGKFHTGKGLIVIFRNNKENIIVSKGLNEPEFPYTSKEEYQENKLSDSFFRENKLIHFQEIFSANKLIGVIFLGERLSKTDYAKEDSNFLQTLLNIAATALENSLSIAELKSVNENLDTKVQQLSTLFDLGKEFSGILEIPRISKLLGFSIIGQLLVTKYAIVIFNNSKTEILDSKFDGELLAKIINKLNFNNLNSPLLKNDEEASNYSEIFNIGIELIVPMKIKEDTRGLILLGARTGGKKYKKSDLDFLSSIGSIAIISIENSLLFKEALEKQKLEKDLELAKKIQQNLLPSELPKMKNFEIAAFNKAAKQVGGDYYDAIRLDENRVLVAIGDVSGKGVQAALLMANLQAFLQTISKQNGNLIDSSKLLNDLVSENTSDGRFITFFWGILNERERSFQSVNMGHNPPLLIRNKKVLKLRMGGMIMGVMPTLKPHQMDVTNLEKDDLIVMFTDGITEAMDKNFNEYSDEKFEELILKLANESAEDILSMLLEEVNKFTVNAEQSDDITAMIIKVK